NGEFDVLVEGASRTSNSPFHNFTIKGGKQEIRLLRRISKVDNVIGSALLTGQQCLLPLTR
ncbi:hypothetical protein, partial [Hymenobacter sp.]|uniref:hypothetical protein n=1 Tax=Hymenobacter sp. TaxID=1898978 RepID=UPI002EDAACE0